MTIEDVVQMFLDAGDDADAIQAILDDGPMSRGTRFAALTRAAMTRSAELQRTSGSLETARADIGALREQVATIEEARQRSQGAIDEAMREVERLQADAAVHAEPLALLADLERRGMGSAELSRLVDTLERAAADQGAPPEEGVAEFLAFAVRFRNVVSLDLETRRARARSETAKAKTERLETELQAFEAASRVRREVIDAVQDLNKQGVKPHDLMNWSVVIKSAGLTPLRLGEALKEFADLEALLARRREEQTALTRAIAALKQERGRYEAELDAIKQQTLRAVSELRDRVQEDVEVVANEIMERFKEVVDGALGLMDRTGKLTGSNVGTLNLISNEIRAAEARLGRSKLNLEYGHAILEWDDESRRFWETAGWLVIAGILRGLNVWMEAGGRDTPIPVPEALRGQFGLSARVKLRPRELILWLATGIDPLQEGVGRA